VPGLRLVAVAGPRLDPAALPQAAGVELRGYVPDLDAHFAACDVALVQGGLTTCMELTAARVPFVYFPLRNHFEQRYHVHHRLQRYGAGVAMDYDAADPERIADAVSRLLTRPVASRPVEPGGAARAARLLAELC
jgi:UDP:flavonoid glycosyltransferase YjiC (YdhE family)